MAPRFPLADLAYRIGKHGYPTHSQNLQIQTLSKTFLDDQTRRIEVVNLAENGREDLMSDLVSIVCSISARLYGQRRAKRKTEKVMEELTKDESEGSLDATGGTTSD
jgi:hypothetical protein